MSHKGKGKFTPMLSPEKYVRQRARTLPLFECLVNSNWQESSMANVVVTRRHTNGNYTLCIYLADLLCQGVKDTHWLFNQSSLEYDEFKKRMFDRQEMGNISYELAHNIIYAAYEYGQEWGFESCRDFNNTTKFMLEEDTEQIEIIDIECGRDGKPVFMGSPYQSQDEAERIIAKLDKNAGPGNYTVIGEPVIFNDFDDDDESGDEVYDIEVDGIEDPDDEEVVEDDLTDGEASQKEPDK